MNKGRGIHRALSFTWPGRIIIEQNNMKASIHKDL